MSVNVNIDMLAPGEKRYIKVGKNIVYEADRDGFRPVRDGTYLEKEPIPASPEPPTVSAAISEKTRLEMEGGRAQLAKHAERAALAGKREIPQDPGGFMKTVVAPTEEPPPEVMAQVVRKDTEQLGVQERFDEQKAGKGPKAKRV